jgi:hypothetical protein
VIPWLSSLRTADDAASRADCKKAMNTPPSTGDVALFSGFMVAICLLAFAGPVWGLWRWRGGWRLLAAVPAAVMAFVVLRIVIDTARDPTSHNLCLSRS